MLNTFIFLYSLYKFFLLKKNYVDNETLKVVNTFYTNYMELRMFTVVFISQRGKNGQKWLHSTPPVLEEPQPWLLWCCIFVFISSGKLRTFWLVSPCCLLWWAVIHEQRAISVLEWVFIRHVDPITGIMRGFWDSALKQTFGIISIVSPFKTIIYQSSSRLRTTLATDVYKADPHKQIITEFRLNHFQMGWDATLYWRNHVGVDQV